MRATVKMTVLNFALFDTNLCNLVLIFACQFY